jgi:methylthioxylose transferase
VAVVLAATGAIVWLRWYSEDRIFAWAPPLLGYVRAHVGWGSPVAVLLAVLVVARGPELAARLSWRALCWTGYAAAVCWAFALALTETWQRGVAERLSGSNQYLWDLPRITGIGAFLRGFAGHIVDGRPGSWVTQVSGHPPGATLVFVALDRLGLSGSTWATIGCVLTGCVAAVAVPGAIRALGREDDARAALPFLVLLPGALWFTSGDALFTGFAAIAIWLLAVGAMRRTWPLCVLAGALLGGTLFLSYGLVLLVPIALAVCVAARNWRAATAAVAGVVPVVVAFAAAGFWWFTGYQLVKVRYYQGVGFTRPYNYWVWADLACLVLCAGPVLAPALRRALTGPFTGIRPVAALVLGAAIAIAVADISGLSKAEVERIWLPFAVWLTAGAALLPAPSRRWWLAGQALTALLVGHLVMTFW